MIVLLFRPQSGSCGKYFCILLITCRFDLFMTTLTTDHHKNIYPKSITRLWSCIELNPKERYPYHCDPKLGKSLRCLKNRNMHNYSVIQK